MFNLLQEFGNLPDLACDLCAIYIDLASEYINLLKFPVNLPGVDSDLRSIQGQSRQKCFSLEGFCMPNAENQCSCAKTAFTSPGDRFYRPVISSVFTGIRTRLFPNPSSRMHENPNCYPFTYSPFSSTSMPASFTKARALLCFDAPG